MNILQRLTTPSPHSGMDQKNFLNVQIDAIGIGLANSAAPFLPVFLTRLGASSFQIGLLTSMPALTGLIMAIFIGRFLQSRKNVVPWFSAARLMVVLSYALTGIIPFIVPRHWIIPTILLIWAVATLPQTVVSIGFSVVMNAVAGPTGRFELMSRRWSIMGFTQTVVVIIVGQILEFLKFPVNYQMVFMGLSIGGLLSYYYSSHLSIPDNVPVPLPVGKSLKYRLQNSLNLIWQEKPFVAFTAKRFVYLMGVTLAIPIFPQYYVRVINASDAWISVITTAQTAILILGYFFWIQQSRKKGSRRTLLLATLGMSFYPALVSVTHQVQIIALISGVAGIFQAGIDLVFFDELMKTIPPKYSAIFVSVAQSMLFLSSILAPLLGTLLGNAIGLGGALLVSAGLRLIGFLLFATGKPAPAINSAE